MHFVLGGVIIECIERHLQVCLQLGTASRSCDLRIWMIYSASKREQCTCMLSSRVHIHIRIHKHIRKQIHILEYLYTAWIELIRSSQMFIWMPKKIWGAVTYHDNQHELHSFTVLRFLSVSFFWDYFENCMS